MTSLALNPILAAQGELIRVVVLAVIMLGGAILKKITDAREQAEREPRDWPNRHRHKHRPARLPSVRRGAMPNSATPDAVWTGGQEGKAAPRRDNPHRNEIEQFLEEVGRRRSPANPAQRGEAVSSGAPPNRPIVRPPLPAPVPIQRNPGQPGRTRPEGPKSPPPVAAQSPPTRPGSEMAMRKAPGTEDFGNQIPHACEPVSRFVPDVAAGSGRSGQRRRTHRSRASRNSRDERAQRTKARSSSPACRS